VSVNRRGRERGQVIVLMALFIPVLFALGAIVIDIGNWYVHKRHLQTQVDAAVLAGGTEFAGCFLNPTGTADVIKSQALRYAGDTLRDSTTSNRQLQEPNDVRVALNSADYWSPLNGMDATTGYGLDWTMDGNPSTPGAESSLPCDAKFLEAKATDHEAPPLWGLLPLSPSPKARARVEIRKVRSLSGFLPWAVPENDPASVAVLFVDESASNSVLSWGWLTKPTSDTTVNGEAARVWSGIATVLPDVKDGTGVIVLQSRTALTDTDLQGKSLSAICAMAGVTCYGSIRNQSPPTSNRTGIAFIYGAPGPPGSNTAAVYDADASDPFPAARLLLTPPTFSAPPGSPCGDTSAPYFILEGPCDVRLQAQIDFGSNVPTNRTVRVRVGAPFGSNCSGGTDMQKVSSSPPLWESRWITIPAGSGQNRFYLCWTAGTGQQSVAGNFAGQTIQMAFAATSTAASNTVFSGPIIYTTLNPSHALPKSAQTVLVEVGFVPPLQISNGNQPPVFLRVAGSGSLNQMLDCDPSPRQPADEIYSGCELPYQVNTRALQCSPNPTWTINNLPPNTSPSSPSWIDPDCIEANPGQVSALAKGLHDRFEALQTDSPPGAGCPPNRWVQYRSQGIVPTSSDPRYVVLVIANYGEFDAQGNTVLPITKFAGFYVTGWFATGTPSGTQGCPDNDPPPTPPFCNGQPCSATAQRVQGAVWGYFITPVFASPRAKPSDDFCSFDQLGTCIAVLVK
jgi:hypothetical protein